MKKAAHPDLVEALHIWYWEKRQRLLPKSDEM